nr:TPA_exp: type I polyketide synthase [Streptomyces sp. NRRL F-4335]
MLSARFDFSLRNPFVAGHRVGGRALLPGLAYADLVLQGFGGHGHPYAGLELRNTTLFAPLAVEPDSRVPLTLTAREHRAGAWSVDLSSGPVQYAAAEVRTVGPAGFAGRGLDPAAERARAQHSFDLADVYRHCRGQGLEHSGVMQVLGTVHRSADGVFAELSLPDEALPDAGEFLAHPALLDAAAVAAGHALSLDEPHQALHLPMCYESFRITAPLTRTCLARVPADSVRRQGGLLTLSFEFFDASGRQIAELSGFTSKPERAPHGGASAGSAAPVSARAGEDWDAVLRAELAAELGTAAPAVDPRAGFYEMGLDSAALLRLVHALQRRLDTTLPPTLLFEHTTVHDLAGWLTAHHPAPAGPARTPVAPAAAAPAPAPQTPAPSTAPAATARAGRDPVADSPDLAVVGLSGRYPGAYDLDAFWRNLRAGADCVTPVPAERWDRAAYGGGRRGEIGHNYCDFGGFIEDADKFDPLFFSISPREAVAVDPLERLFLEHSWAALEDAGHTRSSLCGPVGVYVGAMFQDYPLLAAEGTTPEGRRVGLGAGGASIANRVSYFCGFTGPSMMVDTACSGSLTALHLAARALRDGEVDAALVGGVNLSLHPNKYLLLSQGEFLSETGRCAAFGEGADGMVPGEGVGVLLLKRLADAERDGDHVYGLVKGTAVNHGGRTGGFTVPGPQAQQQVIEAALADARIDPRTVTCVEAHGTGTALGDPIEVAGLARALGSPQDRAPECALGSVKSGIGHLEAAAGVAGVTKALLQLHHRQLVPTLHADPAAGQLGLEGTRFRISGGLRPWKRPFVDGREQPLRAGVSSFGAGGSNAHVVLEEYRDTRGGQEAGDENAGPALVVLSARDEDRLRASAERLRAYLAAAGDPSAAGGPDPVLDRLGALAARIAGRPTGAIAPEADLAVEGFDSVARARLLLAVGREYGVSPAPTTAEDHSTLARLARHLRTEHGVGGTGAPVPAVAEAPRALPSVHAVAYTLLVGREAREERLALVVRDTAELVAELDAYLDGRPSARRHRGSTASERSARVRETAGAAADGLLAAAVAGGDLDEVAQLWVSGLAPDPGLLHPRPPVRVPLPSYPFARERYWITDVLTGPRPAGAAPAASGQPPAGPPAVPSLLAAVEEDVVTRPRVYEVESSMRELAEYQDTVAALSRICRVSLLAAFREMGALRVAGEHTTRRRLREQLSVAGRHDRLFDALLGLLEEAGYLRLDGEEVTVAAVDEHDLQAEVDGLAAEKRALLDRAPDNDGLLTVLDNCLQAYPEVLADRRDPLDVLFPGGSFAQMDAIYKNQQQTNALMAEAVRSYVARRVAADPAARVTVLEIGAGTGGTSRGVLAAVAPYAEHLRYHYTDLGSSFVQYGAAEYGSHGFVEFRQLDIERSPAEQGFEPGSVDVVVASNVLHATRSIHRTLTHAKSVMRPGGMIALFEVTRLHELLTIAFGLLEGWWAFEDTDRLPGSPLLSAPMWRRAMERAGFRGMRVLSGMPLREDRLSESVLLAESEGRPVEDAAPAPVGVRPVPAPAAPVPAAAPAPAPVAPVPVAAPAPAPDPVPVPVPTASAPLPATPAPAEGVAANDLEALIDEAWKEVLGVDRIRPTDTFQDLGGDSIMASRIKARLNNALPFELELRELLTATTVREMALQAEAEIIERIDELPEDAVLAMTTD